MKIKWKTSNGVPPGVYFSVEVITYDADASWNDDQHAWFKANVGKQVMGCWEEFQGRLAFRPLGATVVLYEHEILMTRND